MKEATRSFRHLRDFAATEQPVNTKTKARLLGIHHDEEYCRRTKREELPSDDTYDSLNRKYLRSAARIEARRSQKNRENFQSDESDSVSSSADRQRARYPKSDRNHKTDRDGRAGRVKDAFYGDAAVDSSEEDLRQGDRKGTHQRQRHRTEKVAEASSGRRDDSDASFELESKRKSKRSKFNASRRNHSNGTGSSGSDSFVQVRGKLRSTVSRPEETIRNPYTAASKPSDRQSQVASDISTTRRRHRECSNSFRNSKDRLYDDVESQRSEASTWTNRRIWAHRYGTRDDGCRNSSQEAREVSSQAEPYDSPEGTNATGRGTLYRPRQRDTAAVGSSGRTDAVSPDFQRSRHYKLNSQCDTVERHVPPKHQYYDAVLAIPPKHLRAAINSKNEPLVEVKFNIHWKKTKKHHSLWLWGKHPTLAGACPFRTVVPEGEIILQPQWGIELEEDTYGPGGIRLLRTWSLACLLAVLRFEKADPICSGTYVTNYLTFRAGETLEYIFYVLDEESNQIIDFEKFVDARMRLGRRRGPAQFRKRVLPPVHGNSSVIPRYRSDEGKFNSLANVKFSHVSPESDCDEEEDII